MLSISEVNYLEKIAKQIRRNTIKMYYNSQSSHIGSALSIIDILTVLYFRILNIDINDYKNVNRDKFILSKGHSIAALYSTLALRGFFKEELLLEYYQNGSQLSGHPKKDSLPGIEASTGSLGHGLAIGCGLALADNRDNRKSKSIILMGDGECNEGSVWESAMFAKGNNLNNLIAIVDNNKLQGLGYVSQITGVLPLAEKWKAFGWNVKEINGHDIEEIYNSLISSYNQNENPTVIIADTIKGKGVSFMEGKLEWHYKSPNNDQLKIALKELQ